MGHALQQAREATAPGLDVSLLIGVAPVPDAREHVALVRLAGGTPPLRLYLYVDGELREGWMPAPEMCEIPLLRLRPGRHAVTIRAVDTHGRWGGASALVGAEGSGRSEPSARVARSRTGACGPQAPPEIREAISQHARRGAENRMRD